MLSFTILQCIGLSGICLKIGHAKIWWISFASLAFFLGIHPFSSHISSTYIYDYFPQNQTFARADIMSHFCHGFNNSLILIHRDSLHFSNIFTIGSMMSHFSHDAPYIESTSEILCYILFRHVPSYYIINTEGYISATPSNNTYKGLTIMYILCYMFFHHFTSLQKDIYVYIYTPAPQTIRIKVL